MFDDLLTRVSRFKFIPVIALEDEAKADDLAEALLAGGLPLAEITLRTNAALGAIRSMARRGDMLVGAGTVRTPDQAREARDAGAAFLVSPGFSADAARWALKENMPLLPGVDSTLGIEVALALGFDTVKFFPAVASGGLPKIRALHAPYPELRFIPTGGVNAGSLPKWLAHPAVIACGGSWPVSKELLAAGDWNEVTRLTREALTAAGSA